MLPPFYRSSPNWSSSFPSVDRALLHRFVCASSPAPITFLPAWCWTGLFCHCYYGETPSACMATSLLLLLLLLSVTLIRIVEDLGQRLLLPPKRTEKTPPTSATTPSPPSLLLFLCKSCPHTIPVWEMCCEWALIWTKCQCVNLCVCVCPRIRHTQNPWNPGGLFQCFSLNKTCLSA